MTPLIGFMAKVLVSISIASLLVSRLNRRWRRRGAVEMLRLEPLIGNRRRT